MICKACDGTGLKSATQLCPECDGTPDFDDPAHADKAKAKKKADA